MDPIDLQVRLVCRLAAIDAGVARIEQAVRADLDRSAPGIAIPADGHGSGQIFHDVGARPWSNARSRPAPLHRPR